ncbi:GNAT family N-acetyltransferase [Frigoribacterium sp. VKM Ac-2530]|uniref:GNAT family N-acetyltransferase n=1 Tax=Frigoribacterium sp. VKM Ac-2530 TaxID=2783822 RepID=UPI00188B0A7C|nr:GNAT family N-acetyltransferase [Frigoribacterium sp. VKM Ac-2530]MBF4578164.1 GNAT family N-acetyltransferase [Frigoribacterium sp. VKM Ac-2530]
MILKNGTVALEPITPALALRIVARDERPGDKWHAEYPFLDELDPLRSLAASASPDPCYTMYVVRRASDGMAVGGFGSFGPPDADGRVEFGYGLVPSARGAGLATSAVLLALGHAARHGATIAAADTEADNAASRRVLTKGGLAEVGRSGSVVLYERVLTAGQGIRLETNLRTSILVS